MSVKGQELTTIGYDYFKKILMELIDKKYLQIKGHLITEKKVK